MTNVDGIIAMNDDDIVGLLTYVISDDICEITSLDSMEPEIPLIWDNDIPLRHEIEFEMDLTKQA